MGVKYVWSILSPYCERKPLYELQGKTVAIDLSCWVCEAQNITEYYIQPRMYLRNLYFRTCYLLLMDVAPVFVLEGKAPGLKYDTIAARNAIQFKGAKPREEGAEGKKVGKDRSRFHFVLKQCAEMLGYMGLACITGSGEAEATCAYLNNDQLVDGCISQDSDCFAYGARVVYRNFSISQQGAHAGTGGAVDIYDITKAHKSIGFGRNKIIAMAILCGCDYFDGIHGIGKDSALKLFEKVTEEAILDRLRSWKKNNSLYREFENKVSDKNICTSCGHSGRLQNHNKTGCSECRTTSGCDFSRFKNERTEIKNELNMRSKALVDPDFPHEELISEFLEKKDNISKLNLKWKQPDMVKFVKFTSKYLQWEEIYAFEKLLPILTRWQLLNYDCLDEHKSKGIIYPDCIKKKRTARGISSYEIIWHDKNKHFPNIIPEEQLSGVDPIKLWSTIEPQHLVKKAYPDIVETFEQSKIKPKKPSKRKLKAKSKGVVDELGNILANTSITDEPKLKKKTKKKEKNEVITSNILDNFLDKVSTENSDKSDYQNEPQQLLSSFNICSTPSIGDSQFENFLMNVSSLDDDDDADLSKIVEEIVSRSPLRCISDLQKAGHKFIFDDIEPQENNWEKCECSFFISNKTIDNDLFETFFENRFESDDDMNENDENVANDVLKTEKKVGKMEVLSTSDDSDISDCDNYDNYVPLLERLNNKCSS